MSFIETKRDTPKQAKNFSTNQGVGRSSRSGRANENKHLGQSVDWPFCFLGSLVTLFSHPPASLWSRAHFAHAYTNTRPALEP